VLEPGWSAGQPKQVLSRNLETAPLELRKTAAAFLTNYVVLLAMKHRCAPLPVSSNLRKELLHRGLINNLDELGILARRYLFLGDARMLLAELEMRPRIPTQRFGGSENSENRLEAVRS
jgi:hypothetical protein